MSSNKKEEVVCEYMYPQKNNKEAENERKNQKTDLKSRKGNIVRCRSCGNDHSCVNSNSYGCLEKSKNRTYTSGVYIYMFRNGDPFFIGKKMLISERLYRNWEQFIISVIRKVQFVKSSCRIYSYSTGKEIKDFSQLSDNEKYIAAFKNDKLNLNIDYRTLKEEKEYQMRREFEDNKKNMIIQEKYIRKKNDWIYREEQKRLIDLKNKKENLNNIDEANDNGLLKKFKLERITQEQKRILYKQKKRENYNAKQFNSLDTVEPEKVFDREMKGYRIYIHKNGDYFTTGYRFVLNFNNSFSLLSMVLNIRETIPELWYIRRIYNIDDFKRVKKIEEIQDGHHYIATGKENVRRDQSYKVEPEEKLKNISIIIHVYPNGDGFSIPTNIRVTSQKFPTFDKLIRYIDKHVRLITGCIKILYNMNGRKITTIGQLENEREYVAASYNQPFYNIPYNVNSFRRNRKYTQDPTNINNNSYNNTSSVSETNGNRNNNENNKEIQNERERYCLRTQTSNKEVQIPSRINSRSISPEPPRSKSESYPNSCKIAENRHVRSKSEAKVINRSDPDSERRAKTEQGSGIRSPKNISELKSCLMKSRSKDKEQNVVIDSVPDILDDNLYKTAPTSPKSRSHSRSQSVSQSACHTASPSASHSRSPSAIQSRSPSASQSRSPTASQSRSPTASQSRSPSASQSRSPSRSPSRSQSRSPSRSQSKSPPMSQNMISESDNSNSVLKEFSSDHSSNSYSLMAPRKSSSDVAENQ